MDSNALTTVINATFSFDIVYFISSTRIYPTYRRISSLHIHWLQLSEAISIVTNTERERIIWCAFIGMSSFRGKSISQPGIPYIQPSTMLPPPVSHSLSHTCHPIDLYSPAYFTNSIGFSHVNNAAIKPTTANTYQCVPIGSAALRTSNTNRKCFKHTTNIHIAKYHTANKCRQATGCLRNGRSRHHRFRGQHQRTRSRTNDQKDLGHGWCCHQLETRFHVWLLRIRVSATGFAMKI